jgi:hypothetical protein
MPGGWCLGTYAHLMPGDSGDDGSAAVDRFFGGAAPDALGQSVTH